MMVMIVDEGWQPGWRMTPREMVDAYIAGGREERRALDDYLASQREAEQRDLQEWLYPRPADLPDERETRWFGDAAHDPR